jgi:hypothetical protein
MAGASGDDIIHRYRRRVARKCEAARQDHQFQDHQFKELEALEAGREKFRRLFAQVNSARNIGNRFLFARLQLWSGQR